MDFSIGRLMNRFTKDLGSLDEMLPPTFFDMLIIFSMMGGIGILVTLANYYMVVPAVILVVALYLLATFYITSARAIKRIEGISKVKRFLTS